MDKSNNQVLRKMVLISMAIVFIISVLCDCGSSNNKMYGTWVPNQSMSRDYPEEYLRLDKNGVGSGDGYDLDWYVDDGELYIIMVGPLGSKHTYSYTIEVFGKEMYLDGYLYRKVD